LPLENLLRANFAHHIDSAHSDLIATTVPLLAGWQDCRYGQSVPDVGKFDRVEQGPFNGPGDNLLAMSSHPVLGDQHKHQHNSFFSGVKPL
jgi:hypothetical protein